LDNEKQKQELHMTNSESPREKNRLLALTQKFLELEAAGGLLLFAAAVLALIAANSPLLETYEALFSPLVRLGINDGLMAIFFLLVGLEIKREFVSGQLSSREQAMLPALAAAGGMIVPALIYAFINKDSPATLHGWAIPSATDIAFSLGVLALLGSRVPLSLKILLTAIAVMDDLGAILIIAFFYSAHIFLLPLAVAAVCTVVLMMLNYKGIYHLTPYLLVGAVLWGAMLKSGIHPTIAGVITALSIPAGRAENTEQGPLEALEHVLHPWVVYMILPVFAFANAGVPFKGMTLESFLHPVALGVTMGLFAGKIAGIFGTIFLFVKTGLCKLPEGITWGHIWGLAHMCGIGFTMSLFIGELALGGGDLQAEIRLGVLTGSILSALAGYMVLRKRA
jgi:NhaA family Na+:H+ antiporter